MDESLTFRMTHEAYISIRPKIRCLGLFFSRSEGVGAGR